MPKSARHSRLVSRRRRFLRSIRRVGPLCTLLLLGCSSGHGSDLFAARGGAAGSAGSSSGSPDGGTLFGGASAGGRSESTGTGGLVANGGGSGAGGLVGSGGVGAGGRGAGETGGTTSRGGSGSAESGAPSAGGDASGSEPRALVYLDVSGRVLRLTEGASSPHVLVSDAGDGPDGVAVDVAAGHVFWTVMGAPAENDGKVLRSDLDGSHVVEIVPAGDTYTPKQLKIDAAGKKLYWSDREGMKVQRASLDGSNLETLVSTGTTSTDRKNAANWCVGLALDLDGGYFYWTQKGPDNGKVGSIRRAHLRTPSGETERTRSDIEVLYEGLPEPVDLEVDTASGMMYWTDRGDDTINRSPIEVPRGKTAATRTDREILIRGVREAIGVALDVDRGHLYFTGGTEGRVGRANLDGSGAENLLTGNAALTGITVIP